VVHVRLGRFLYSDEYEKKITRSILNLQLQTQTFFVSSILVALKGSVRVYMHGTQQIYLLEIGDRGQPPTGAKSLKIATLGFKYRS